MSRTKVIEEILGQRAQRAKELTALDGVAGELDRALAELDRVRTALVDKVEDDTRVRFLAMGDQVNEIRSGIAGVRIDIGRTATRFRRQALTVGAVGRSGQGKSAFLQSLTGLSNQEIPAARGTFTTGTPSLIRHGDGPTMAEAELYDEASFLDEVLQPYYSALGLGPVPGSLDAFGDAPLPELPPQYDSARERAAYDHLASYRDSLPEYQDLLRGPSRFMPIGRPEEIIRYVAQHDGTGRPTHTFRAVRRVRITTKFGQPDLGKVAVIDLPGLGDTNLRDEYLLRQAIDGEVDIVLFLRRPDPIRDGVQDTDVALYDVARNAMPELPLDRWSFLLLNHVQNGDAANTDMVASFPAMIQRSKLHVVDVLAADCTDQDLVNAAFDTIIGHAVAVVAELDASLLDRRRQELAVQMSAALRLVAEAEALLGARAISAEAEYPRFLELFDDVHSELSGALAQLVEDYRENSTASDEELARQLQETIKAAGEAVLPPTIAEIERRNHDRGGYVAAVAEFNDQLRAELSVQFLSLEQALRVRVDTMHADLVTVLRTQGRLGAAWPEKGKDYLDRLAGQVDQVPGRSAELSRALRYVADFTLNYRGFIQHRVRRVLNQLDPDTQENIYTEGASPEEIRYRFEEIIPDLLNGIKLELSSMGHEPYEVVFAITEEFRDRVLRAKGTMRAWEAVYRNLRFEVWPEEFEALAANTSLFNQWKKALDGVSAVAGKVA